MCIGNVHALVSLCDGAASGGSALSRAAKVFICSNHFADRPFMTNGSFVKPQAVLTEGGQHLEIMADQDDEPGMAHHFRNAGSGLGPKTQIADAETLIDQEDLRLDGRGPKIRWVPRGGGCWLHHPGQFALYAVMPLDSLGLTIPEYLARLGSALVRVLDDFSVHQATRATEVGVCVGSRPVATLGVCVRDHVTMFGSVFNLCPDLELFRGIRCHPAAREPMSSLERERRGAVRPAMVRERIVEHIAAAFGIPHIAPFSDHVLLQRKSIERQKAIA